jgi:hypothetical protein|tara:strand:- start:110 stop:388 length:279 start_codon:yes stop_codon:yes gene_type:complete
MTIQITDKNYFDKFLSTIKNNTDNNLHTENCMLIAVNFGTEVQKEEMHEVSKNHNDLNCINPITSIARKYLIKNILKSMKNRKLSKSINNRL